MPNCDGLVVVVDDDEVVRESFQCVLASAGLKTVSSSRPQDALNSGVLSTAQRLLTDLDMPEMDGRELQLHTGFRFPQLPVVFISGTSNFEMRGQVLRRGAFAFWQNRRIVGSCWPRSVLRSVAERSGRKQMHN